MSTATLFTLSGINDFNKFRKSVVSAFNSCSAVFVLINTRVGEWKSSSPTIEPLNKAGHAMDKSILLALKKSDSLCVAESNLLMKISFISYAPKMSDISISSI